MFLAKIGHGAEELGRRLDHAAFALDRLQQNSGGFGMHGVFKCSDVVERQIAEAGQQRIETLLDFRLTGGGHRTERAAVERLQEGDHLVTLRTVSLRAFAAEAAGGFDQAVIRLGAGIGEEDFPRKAHVVGVDFLGKFGLERILIEIGNVHQLAGLVADRFDEFRVAMTERTHGDAHAEIQIAFSRFVPQPRTGASHGDQRKAAVSG